MAQLPAPAALVHEWFTPRSVGGAELVVRELDALLGQPALFSLVDGESRRGGSWLEGRTIHTSFVQGLPWGVSHVQQYLPLLPLAIEQLDLSGYPLVLSSSHLVAKGVLTSPDQCHISYVHTPVRYAWDQMHAYLRQSALARRGLGPLIRWQLHRLRQWDLLSAQRPDALIANSRFTAARIQRYWGRDAAVVHPPVAVERFRWDQPRDDVYLCLCRLVPYKRVDLVVEAFNRTGLPLVVIGDGPERARLQALARPNVTLLGRLGQAEVTSWLGRCRAYVYAGLEDFGIAPLEAMAAGAPVIGLGQGGLLDTMRCLVRGDSQPTGVLFPQQSVAALMAALEQFEAQRLWRQLPADSLRQWAEQFSPDRFRQRMAAAIERAWGEHQRQLAQRSCALSVPLP
ncbi:glycosyltransferase [Vulcanococcus sp.]|jgi:glycosyltransferase involved in cell wall biosynthesis|uniref:glycosyltransferase n=1 Tax=Vulcanococcus sp. TaxID=2856995 RepID=UPI0037D9A7CE